MPIDLANREQLVSYLKLHRLWLDRQVGQHFLVDAEVRNAIVAAADLEPTDTVLEIGPGAGALTYHLAGAVPKGLLLAVERDPRFVELLRNEFKGKRQVKIIHDDILRFDPATVEGDYQLVANVPYQITGAILRKFFDPGAGHQSSAAVLMVQKEVGERLLAEAGSSERGVTTVLVELYGKVAKVIDVSRTAFFPVPEVDSIVVKLSRHPEYEPREAGLILQMAKAGFAAKRRTLANAIGGSLRMDKLTVLGAIKQAGIDPFARAEDVALSEWQALSQNLAESLKTPS